MGIKWWTLLLSKAPSVCRALLEWDTLISWWKQNAGKVSGMSQTKARSVSIACPVQSCILLPLQGWLKNPPGRWCKNHPLGFMAPRAGKRPNAQHNGDGHQRRKIQLLGGATEWQLQDKWCNLSEGPTNATTQSKHEFLHFVPSVPDEKKDILTWTLQSWYLLDVPVQVLLASPLTDFLLNKEMMVRQGSNLSFPF